MEKLISDVVVNQGRNNYFNAKANAQKNKTAFRTTQRLKQSLNHNCITYQIINETKINLEGRQLPEKHFIHI